MNISGLQKMTLLDYPEKVATTVFTGGCNFRCPFCHNASFVINPNNEGNISEEAFFEFLIKRKGLLDGVCISGGEPLLQKEISGFIHKIKNMGFLVKLDTNGSFPDKLKELLKDGLIDYVAMDIKNSPASYAKTAGTGEEILPRIKESVGILLKSNIDYEFRTTVVKDFHTKEDFIEIGKLIKGAKRYFLQYFVDSGDLIQPGLKSVEKSEMEAFADIVRGYVPEVGIRGV
ncbi:MAG: anaerobic ribonucleoside-triphosphate reductase activating protein [Lachnospiraceae bacterium]|nr:anaerobic ribonucleoside-triphosphate reductase activating protein [Lachnospiraceae bacterium]